MKRFSRHALILIQGLISAGFIYFLLRKTNLDQVGSHLAAASVPLLTLALVAKFCGFSMMAIRLQRFADASGSFSLGESYRAQSIAFVGNNVLPFRLGEALKVGFMANCGLSSISTCVGIAGTERILDSFFLVLLIGASALLFSDLIPNNGGLYLFSGVASTGFVVLFLTARFPDRFGALVARTTRVCGEGPSRILTDHASQFARGVSALASGRVFLELVALTAGYWFFSTLSLCVLILACGIEVPWYAPIGVLVFVSLSTVIPSAPGFVGTYHYFAALALSLFGVGADVAASFAIVSHAVAIIPFTILLSPLVAKDIVALRRGGVSGGGSSAARMDTSMAEVSDGTV
ncbi:MAG: flippase-like domain-containing protein [bacterium]|nr:flippase-like domain-containing protein [bacterium]